MTLPFPKTSAPTTAGQLTPAGALAIIDAVYPADDPARAVLLDHGRQVADKALAVARHLASLALDLVFVESAALLHDIGMIHTHAPTLGCHGPHEYLRHGVLGREILDARGWPAHGRVCERHVGAGISREEIIRQGLDLPLRDMRPVTIEEQIICYADKFFSKSPANGAEKTVDEILAGLARHGAEQAKRFSDWVELFEGYPDDGQMETPR